MKERRSESRSTRPRRGRRGPEHPPSPPVLPVGPAFPGDPTPDQRVSDFLAERYGRRVGELRVIPLSGDASSRRYYRVHDDDEQSVISLNPEPFDPEQLPFVVIRNLMAGWGLPVPEIRATDGARGILLQEDLGDLSLQESLKEASPSRREELYRQALDQLVVLQREAARAPQRAICFQIAFDFEKLSWEMHFFWKHFLEGYRKCDLSVEDRASLADGFHRLCAEISSWPRVLTHRDFHSRNLMSYGDRLFWIDFQDARMGPAHYDLASLLRDSYVELDEDFVADRAEEFRQRAVPGEARDTFQRRFELMSIQRNLKALGTFGYQTLTRANTVYIQYIPRTLRYARASLER
ncbi:MAG TPA: phosphotransferase, partial [Vicinamibacteria bacterium]|nr:phosphotransferase [Vicinamibacteria bacterium]